MDDKESKKVNDQKVKKNDDQQQKAFKKLKQVKSDRKKEVDIDAALRGENPNLELVEKDDNDDIEEDNFDDDYEAEDELDDDEVLRPATFKDLFTEKRWCYVEIMDTDGSKRHIKVFSVTEEQRSKIQKQCEHIKYDRRTQRIKVVKPFDEEKFSRLMVVNGLDPEFMETVPGNTLDEKMDEIRKVFGIGDLHYILSAIQKISGIDMDNIELTKKGYGLVAYQTKPLLTQLLQG